MNYLRQVLFRNDAMIFVSLECVAIFRRRWNEDGKKIWYYFQ